MNEPNVSGIKSLLATVVSLSVVQVTALKPHLNLSKCVFLSQHS